MKQEQNIAIKKNAQKRTTKMFDIHLNQSVQNCHSRAMICRAMRGILAADVNSFCPIAAS